VSDQAGRRFRLAAAERRAALLDSACHVFSDGSYRGTTTAEIARAAGVTEPILYRHFPSKRALYLACVEETWLQVRDLWSGVIADEADPEAWIPAMVRSYRESGELRGVMSTLWIQALAEAIEDAEIRAYMRGHMSEVHAFVSDVHRRAQQAGAIRSDADSDAEAWLFISIGLLRAASDCLDGLADTAFPAISVSRQAWLAGGALTS
jgi:AcrR family transcriptional regulator